MPPTCSQLPAVLNGEILNSTSASLEYQCLTGFYMTGSKILICTSGTWNSDPPTCNPIRDVVTVFPDWWLIVAIIVACLLALACFICLICYFCCGGHRARGTRVRRYDDHDAGCCSCCGGGSNTDICVEESARYQAVRSSSASSSQAGVFFLPVRPAQGGDWRLWQAMPLDIHSKGRTAASTQTGDVAGTKGSPGVERMARPWKSTSNIITIGANKDHNDVMWKVNSLSRKTQTDDDMLLMGSGSSGARPWEKRAKEVHAWMPHKHPVRNINTSTK